MTDRSLRIDVYSPAGVKLATGPVVEPLALTYAQRVNGIGVFEMVLPAEIERASIITQGVELRVYKSGEGLLPRFLVDSAEVRVTLSDRVLVVSGATIARKLVWSNTLNGLQFNDVSLGSAMSSLLSGEALSPGQLDTPAANLASQPFYGVSKWAAAGVIAEAFGLLLREDAINAEVDVGAFGTNPNGIRFQSVEEMTPGLAASGNVFAIAEVAEVATSGEIWNRIIPQGREQGIAGTSKAMDLELSTRTSPYTIQNAVGPDGLTYYYLEDSTSVAAYGRRTKLLSVPDAAPVGITATDLQRAANTLYDRAATWLQRHTTPQTAYAVRVVGVKHIVNGQPVFQVGDKVRVIYRGEVSSATGGPRLWKSIDASLYVMEYKRSLGGDGTDSWEFVLSDVARHPTDDGNVVSEFIEQVTAMQTVPMPYVLFGNGVARLSNSGMDFVVASDPKLDGSTDRKVGWTTADFLTRYAEVFGARNTTFNYNYLTAKVLKAADSQAIVGIYDSSGAEWDVREEISQIGGGTLFSWAVVEGAANTLFALLREDANNAKVYVRKAGTLVEVGGMTQSPVISSFGNESLGGMFNPLPSSADAVALTANKRYYVPFVVHQAITVTKAGWYNGGTAADNIEMAVYNESGTRLFTTGSVAMSGTNTLQAVDVADYALAPGRYYMSYAINGTTGRPRYTAFNNNDDAGIAGVLVEASAFTAPTSATFASCDTGNIPVMWLLVSPRTVI